MKSADSLKTSQTVTPGVRVLIVDDHPLVRESLAKIIQREPDLTVCGEAEDRDEALAMTASAKPDLAIVDLTLKNSFGLDLVKDLCKSFPNVRVLVLSMHDETLHAERAVRAGAMGYIAKTETPAKILAAVRKILGGEVYWSERAATAVVSKIVRPSHMVTKGFSLASLSDREMQVFEMLGSGHTTAQIAAALCIDKSTVETYRTRIKEKLNLKNAVELLQSAINWSNDPRT